MSKSDSNGNCPECNGRLRRLNTEIVCENCGLVSDEDAIDRGPEWRSFDDSSSNRRRTGAPLTRSRHDRGLSTEIGYGNSTNSSYQTRLTGRKRRQIARLRREHNRARVSSKTERNQVFGNSEIRRLITRLSLPTYVRDQACALFKSAQSAGLFQGRSLEGFAAAAVYATARTRSNPRTIGEVTAIAYADERELNAAYSALNRELGLETGPINPVNYLPRYASELDVGSTVERRAHGYANALVDAERVSGRNPSGIAGGCLYKAAQDCDDAPSLTQAAVADVADVAPVTIRSTVELIQSLSA
ncbi:transcription initiation factor IIB family protein [Natronolimnobius sp. AArcel1]|uniref:transcription initiation factor IIB n=1 Tax=Natronolimnobius sp. AArcel1 TaxID=1679093 RepID=UPI0013EA8B8D|nr:transcription initiation factor IIB family protein [Natronolimnobius sp. AArcel1]NGM68556.1 transcription initiation factor IIB family protein [Natronolimnobius sp. AArcel1]